MSWDDVEDEQVRQGVKKIFNDAGFEVGYNRMDHLKADIEATTYKMFGRDNRGYQGSAETDARIAAQERKNKELKAEMDYIKYQMWQERKKKEEAEQKEAEEKAERERKEREEELKKREKWEKEHPEEAKREREEAQRRKEREWEEMKEAARLKREEAERRWEAGRPQREEAERQREQERLAREEAERQRLEAERLAKEEAERQRLEAERLAKEEAERQRLERERLAAEREERLAQGLAKNKNWVPFRIVIGVLLGAVGGIMLGGSAMNAFENHRVWSWGFLVMGVIYFIIFACNARAGKGGGGVLFGGTLGVIIIPVVFLMLVGDDDVGFAVNLLIGIACGVLVAIERGKKKVESLNKKYGDPEESAKAPAP